MAESNPLPRYFRVGIDDVVRTDETGDVDLSLVEYCLSLTPAQRLQQAESLANFAYQASKARGQEWSSFTNS